MPGLLDDLSLGGSTLNYAPPAPLTREAPSQLAAMGDMDPERGLIDTLRLIQQASAAPLIPQGNPLAQIAGSLAMMTGGVAGGLTGQPNPYLLQQQSLREGQLKGLAMQGSLLKTVADYQETKRLREIQMSAEVRRDQLEREKLEMAKETSTREMGLALLKSDAQGLRDWGAKALAPLMNRYGMKVDEESLRSIAVKVADPVQMKLAAQHLYMGGEPARVSEATGVSMATVSLMDQAMQNPNQDQRDGALKTLGLPTGPELEKDRLEATIKNQDVILNQMKILDPKVPEQANLIALRDYGKPFFRLTETERKAAAREALEFVIKEAQARVALQPMPADSARLLVSSEMAAKDLGGALTLWQTKRDTISPFVGPMLTGAPLREGVGRNLPPKIAGSLGMTIPKEVVAIDQKVDTARNMYALAQSGQAVTPGEFTRLMQQLPDRTRDNPDVFDVKLRAMVQNSQVLAQRMQSLMAPGGRQKSLSDVILSMPLEYVKDASPTIDLRRMPDGRIEVIAPPRRP